MHVPIEWLVLMGGVVGGVCAWIAYLASRITGIEAALARETEIREDNDDRISERGWGHYAEHRALAEHLGLRVEKVPSSTVVVSVKDAPKGKR